MDVRVGNIKKAEHQRIDAFELWCWRRLLRVPRTARRSNQSILKEISPEYSLEGLRLKLKLQYFGHLMQRADSFEKTLKLGKIEGRRRRGRQRMRWHQWLNGHEFEQAPGRWWWTRKSGTLQSMGSQREGHDWVTEQQQWQYSLGEFKLMSPASYLWYRLCGYSHWVANWVGPAFNNIL